MSTLSDYLVQDLIDVKRYSDSEGVMNSTFLRWIQGVDLARYQRIINIWAGLPGERPDFVTLRVLLRKDFDGDGVEALSAAIEQISHTRHLSPGEVRQFTVRQLVEALQQPEQSPPIPDEVGQAKPPPLPSGEYKFERDGKVWRLQFAEEKGTFKGSKGLRCIARLLEKPDQPIEALDIEGIDPTRIPRGGSDANVLSEDVKADYQNRLREVDRDKKIAGDSGDEREYRRLEELKGGILEQLKKAAGVSGKSRKLQGGSAAVTSHDRVEKAIKAARVGIASERMYKLAEHLETAIKAEGISFAYRPGKPVPDWKISY